MIAGLPTCTNKGKIHEDLRMETLIEFVQKLATNFYENCSKQSNPLIRALGQYDMTQDKHKRPKTLLARFRP